MIYFFNLVLYSTFVDISIHPSLNVTVTGGARGLGITLASALLEAGSHVYCVDISPEPSPKEWAALVVKADELKLVVKYRKLDITDAEAVGECFKGIAAEAPEPVRVLLGAAGSTSLFLFSMNGLSPCRD